MHCQPYQPLPISTGNVGVDRCGTIAYYAAPRVVYARACWPCNQWPIPAQRWPWPGWGAGPGWPSQGSGCGCGSSSALASLLTGGAPLANWMLSAKQAKP